MGAGVRMNDGVIQGAVERENPLVIWYYNVQAVPRGSDIFINFLFSHELNYYWSYNRWSKQLFRLSRFKCRTELHKLPVKLWFNGFWHFDVFSFFVFSARSCSNFDSKSCLLVCLWNFKQNRLILRGGTWVTVGCAAACKLCISDKYVVQNLFHMRLVRASLHIDGVGVTNGKT